MQQRKCYERQGAPDFRFLKLDLRDAQPTMGERAADPIGTEARRVKAVARLIELARAPSFDGADPVLLLQLRRFLEIRGHRILTSDDPTAALQSFLGKGRRSRGRPPEEGIEDRNIRIAAEVAIDIAARRCNYEAAVTTIAKRNNLSKKSVENAYSQYKDELIVQAAVEQAHLIEPPKT